jgi:hypothetical protein
MSRFAALRRIDTSSPEALARDLGRLVQELDSALDALERRAEVLTGDGSPEGVRVAPPGTLYLDRAGGTSTTLYVKESGTGKTGWDAK